MTLIFRWKCACHLFFVFVIMRESLPCSALRMSVSYLNESMSKQWFFRRCIVGICCLFVCSFVCTELGNGKLKHNFSSTNFFNLSIFWASNVIKQMRKWRNRHKLILSVSFQKQGKGYLTVSWFWSPFFNQTQIHYIFSDTEGNRKYNITCVIEIPMFTKVTKVAYFECNVHERMFRVSWDRLKMQSRSKIV